MPLPFMPANDRMAAAGRGGIQRQVQAWERLLESSVDSDAPATRPSHLAAWEAWDRVHDDRPARHSSFSRSQTYATMSSTQQQQQQQMPQPQQRIPAPTATTSTSTGFTGGSPGYASRSPASPYARLRMPNGSSPYTAESSSPQINDPASQSSTRDSTYRGRQSPAIGGTNGSSPNVGGGGGGGYRMAEQAASPPRELSPSSPVLTYEGDGMGESYDLSPPPPRAGPLVLHPRFPLINRGTGASSADGERSLVISEVPWWREMYQVDWRPVEVFVKFRQLVEGYQLGANIEMHRIAVGRRRGQTPGSGSHGWDSSLPALSLWGFQASTANMKLVLKPASRDRKWKLLCEPQRGDVRFLTRKIPILGLINVQVGVGHDFQNGTTGWKWKVTSTWGGHSMSSIRHKNTLPICPGFDLRIGWNADYNLPDLHGSIGTGEPTLGLNVGRLYASIERVEAIFTHMN